MRVVHVSPTAFGATGLFGGGERYPVELVRALGRHVSCRLVTFGSHSASSADLTVLRPPALIRGHPAHPVPRGLIRELAGADLVHVHHVRALPSVVAAIAAKASGQRCVATDHGLGPAPRLVNGLFDAFLTVSRYSAATLNVPEEKTTVIFGGADPARFRPEPRIDRSGVLFVGRVTPHKGIDRAIEALPDGASLLVAGTAGHDPRPPESGYRELLSRLAHGRDVRFVNAVDEAELPVLHRSARVFVLPSVDVTCYGTRIAIPELLGLSLLEAMASGTPVIASRVGGVPEIVVDGETGFIVEPGNVAELRDRLALLLTDHALAARMGDNARRHVVERFTWDACAQRCLRAYGRVIASS